MLDDKICVMISWHGSLRLESEKFSFAFPRFYGPKENIKNFIILEHRSSSHMGSDSEFCCPTCHDFNSSSVSRQKKFLRAHDHELSNVWLTEIFHECEVAKEFLN